MAFARRRTLRRQSWRSIYRARASYAFATALATFAILKRSTVPPRGNIVNAERSVTRVNVSSPKIRLLTACNNCKPLASMRPVVDRVHRQSRRCHVIFGWPRADICMPPKARFDFALGCYDHAIRARRACNFDCKSLRQERSKIQGAS